MKKTVKVALVVSMESGSFTLTDKGKIARRTIKGLLGPADKAELEEAMLKLGSANPALEFIILDAKVSMVTSDGKGGHQITNMVLL